MVAVVMEGEEIEVCDGFLINTSQNAAEDEILI